MDSFLRVGSFSKGVWFIGQQTQTLSPFVKMVVNVVDMSLDLRGELIQLQDLAAILKTRA